MCCVLQKRLNAPKHWMLDKLGGIFVSGAAPHAWAPHTVGDYMDAWGGAPGQPAGAAVAWTLRDLATALGSQPLQHK